MGYGYYYLLAVEKLPLHLQTLLDKYNNTEFDSHLVFQEYLDAVEVFGKEVAKFCQKAYKECYDFPEIGDKQYGSAEVHSCGAGNERKLDPQLEKLSIKYPNVVFVLYHCYWDFKCMDVYRISFDEKAIVTRETSNLEDFKIGNYNVKLTFDFDSVEVDQNLTQFFNDDYKFPYE